MGRGGRAAGGSAARGRDCGVGRDPIRRLEFIREETRFEIGLLHDRINALISAEAFLTISFTMAMNNTTAEWGPTFSAFVAPVLSLVGLILAVLAWLGVNASFKIIVEWNSSQQRFMRDKSCYRVWKN